jgi:hypothetical protein
MKNNTLLLKLVQILLRTRLALSSIAYFSSLRLLLGALLLLLHFEIRLHHVRAQHHIGIASKKRVFLILIKLIGVLMD